MSSLNPDITSLVVEELSVPLLDRVLSADIDLRTEHLPIEQITPDIVFENVWDLLCGTYLHKIWSYT